MTWKEEYPGFMSVLNSLDQQPIEDLLAGWESKVRNGHIKRVTDFDIELPVFELIGANLTHNYLAYPPTLQQPQKKPGMHIRFPVIVLLVKNLNKYFRFQVGVLDEKGVRRTFICANNQSITRIKPFECSMPLEMDPGWNEIVFNLGQYCQKAFQCSFIECVSLKIHANCRIARIYFNNKVKTEDLIPPEYKLFMRVQPIKP